MTKNELYLQIQQVRQQLNREKSKQNELEKQWDVLLVFAAKCNERAEAFMQSVQRRKRKLSGLDQLMSRMKSALKYRDRMNDLLSGVEYLQAKHSIYEMMDNLDRQKRKLRDQIETAECRVHNLRRKLEQLQYEYDHLPTEEEDDG